MIRSLAAILALAWCACVAPASAQSVRLEYSGVAYGLVEFGRARIDARFGEEAYDGSASINAVGLAVLFGQTRLSARVRGVRAPEGFSPTFYELDHLYRGLQRNSSIDWLASQVTVRATPNFPYPGDPAPSEAQRREGRDPLSTLLSMGVYFHQTRACDRTFRIFDGRYVYDVTLTQGEAGRYRRGAFDWPVTRCGLRQQRVAGYRHPEDLERRTPPGEIWFAVRPDVPFAVPVRVSSALPLGVASINLTAFTVDGATVP